MKIATINIVVPTSSVVNERPPGWKTETKLINLSNQLTENMKPFPANFEFQT